MHTWKLLKDAASQNALNAESKTQGVAHPNRIFYVRYDVYEDY